MQAPESEVLPGQVSSRLFGGLKAGEVRCVTCICTCMQRAQLLLLPVVCPEAPVPPPPFIHFCFQILPKGSMPVVHFAKSLGGTLWYGGGGYVCVFVCVRWS